MRQSKVFETDTKGSIISSFSLLTDISFLNLSKKVDWQFEAPGLDSNKFKSHIQKTHQSPFTKRENEILILLNNAHSSEQIAEKLYISKHTVNTHRRKLLSKTNCSNTIELLHLCKKNGII
jgi:DNA-binding NarL/FixJ family response regulator